MSNDSLKKVFEFYDPHPGFGGAVVRLPEEMKKVADELNGRKISLEEALGNFNSVVEKIGGYIEIQSSYLAFRYDEKNGRKHCFRLIRYK